MWVILWTNYAIKYENIPVLALFQNANEAPGILRSILVLPCADISGLYFEFSNKFSFPCLLMVCIFQVKLGYDSMTNKFLVAYPTNFEFSLISTSVQWGNFYHLHKMTQWFRLFNFETLPFYPLTSIIILCVYFGSWFRRFQSTVIWPHWLGTCNKVAQHCEEQWQRSYSSCGSPEETRKRKVSMVPKPPSRAHLQWLNFLSLHPTS